jgi:hypothetical protein
MEKKVANPASPQKGLQEFDDIELTKVRCMLMFRNVVAWNSAKPFSISDPNAINGFLSVVEHMPKKYLLTWTTYDLTREDSPKPAKNSNADMYEFRLPLKEIRSIKKHTPGLGGTPYIIIQTAKEGALSPLYFYDGGVKEFLNSLGEFVDTTKSPTDSNLILINDETDLRKTLSAVEVSEMVAKTLQAQAATTNTPAVQQFFNNFKMNVLGKFSEVPKLGRKILHEIQKDSDDESDDDKKKKKTEDTNLGDFEIVGDLPKEVSPLAMIETKQRTEHSLTMDEWKSYLDPEGRVTNVEKLKLKIYQAGILPEVRIHVWPFLLGYFPWNSTYKDRERIREDKRKEYAIYKAQWMTINADQESRFSKYRFRKHTIEKDVVRTDREHAFYKNDDSPYLVKLKSILVTYCFYNFDIGYVQGMNDYLSPILIVMQDENDAFWCFKGWMDIVQGNFHKDQAAIQRQLDMVRSLLAELDPKLHKYFEDSKDCNTYFFCYRWLLVRFKREFSLEHTSLLWEMMWTNTHGKYLNIFMCVTLLMLHREVIMQQQMQFDEVLKYVNDLSGHLDIELALSTMEALVSAYKDKHKGKKTDLMDC